MKRSGALAALAAALVVAQAVPASATVHVRRVGVAGYPRIGVTVSTDDPAPLSPRDVTITENGVRVQVMGVALLAGETRKVDTILAIDVSHSMRGRELRIALAAAESFLLQTPTWIDVGVLAFSEEPTIIAPVTGARDGVMDAVSTMQTTTTAGTALFDAVVTASTMFGPSGQHNLILLTDGRNTTGQADLNRAVAAAAASGVAVFTIALEGGDPDVATLRRLAGSTGGTYTSLTPEDLGAAYRSLAVQLGQQYVITFRSKTPPGAPATLIVSLPGGSAETSVLMPPPAVRPGSGGAAFMGAWLHGNLGAAIPVALTFLAAVSLIVLVNTHIRGRRRRSELGSRISAQPAVPSGPEVDAAGGWVPRPLAQAAEWGAEAAHAAGPVAGLLERAGWKIRVGDLLAPSLLLPLLVGAVVWRLLGPVWGILAGAGLAAIPFVVLSRAGSKRIDTFQGQLPDVMMVLASSLRAGHSFMQALDSVAKEVDDPAAGEFARALAEIQLGRNVDDALTALSARARSPDLDWAVTAINIQRRVGGNLAEVLETVADTIRGREQLRRQIRVLSAEGRYSVYILMGLPFLILAYLSVVNPEYLEPLISTPTGILLLIAGAVLMLIGFLWMRAIVKLDV